MKMEIKSSREIVFRHIRDYFPDDERWNTEKWVRAKDILSKLKKIKFDICGERDLQDIIEELEEVK